MELLQIKRRVLLTRGMSHLLACRCIGAARVHVDVLVEHNQAHAEDAQAVCEIRQRGVSASKYTSVSMRLIEAEVAGATLTKS